MRADIRREISFFCLKREKYFTSHIKEHHLPRTSLCYCFFSFHRSMSNDGNLFRQHHLQLFFCSFFEGAQLVSSETRFNSNDVQFGSSSFEKCPSSSSLFKHRYAFIYPQRHLHILTPSTRSQLTLPRASQTANKLCLAKNTSQGCVFSPHETI